MQRALKKVVRDGGGQDLLSLSLTLLSTFYCSLACTRHCLTSSLCTSLGLTSLFAPARGARLLTMYSRDMILHKKSGREYF